MIWNALTPYVGIFLSALVIDELVGNRDVQRLQMLVIITLVSAAVIALGTALLNKWKETQNAGVWLKVEHIISEKMLEGALETGKKSVCKYENDEFVFEITE